MSNSSVAIILTTWNHYLDTKECLNSLSKISFRNFKIIIVDNNSTDFTLKYLRRYYPKITVISSNSFSSYSKSVNIGLKKALELNTKYSLLLNNDTCFNKYFLYFLVKRMNFDKSIGIVTPKIFFYKNSKIIWYAGGILNMKKGIIVHRGYGQIDNKQYDQQGEVDWCTSCCAMLRNDMLKKVGLFDEKYDMYFSDVAYSLKVKKNGYKLYYEPKSFIRHKISATRSKLDSYKEYMKSKETVRFFFNNSKVGTVKYIRERINEIYKFVPEYGIVYSLKTFFGIFDGLIVSLIK